MTFAPGAANFAEKIVYNGCARPFWVYVKTFLPAFIELWFTLAILDFEDLVRERGFSQSSRDLGKGRRGRRHGRMKLPKGQPGTITRYAAAGTRTLLIVTLPLEFIGFAMLLYVSTDRFFYNWTTLIEEIRCDGQEAYIIKSNTNFGAFPNQSGGAVALPNVDGKFGVWPLQAFGTTIGQGVYELTFAMSVEGTSPINPREYTITIEAPGVLGPTVIEGTTATIGGGQSSDLVLSTTLINILSVPVPVGWTITGPQVPVGLKIEKAHVIIQKLA